MSADKRGAVRFACRLESTGSRCSLSQTWFRLASGRRRQLPSSPLGSPSRTLLCNEVIEHFFIATDGKTSSFVQITCWWCATASLRIWSSALQHDISKQNTSEIVPSLPNNYFLILNLQYITCNKTQSTRNLNLCCSSPVRDFYLTTSSSFDAIPLRRSDARTQMRLMPHDAGSGWTLQHDGRDTPVAAGVALSSLPAVSWLSDNIR